MVTDQQARRLWKLMKRQRTLANAAAKAGMDEKTARKYRDLGRLPSEVRAEHTWRTRPDPFAEVWDEVRGKLEVNSGLEAKTLLSKILTREDRRRRYPGRFADGQLRTLQRWVKTWRALEGQPEEVFFPQEYRPGEMCESAFGYMGDLGVTSQRIPFEHLIYHFVLPYSNWETGAICFCESFESLSEGLDPCRAPAAERALGAGWRAGGPARRRAVDGGA